MVSEILGEGYQHEKNVHLFLMVHHVDSKCICGSNYITLTDEDTEAIPQLQSFSRRKDEITH